MRSSAVRVFGLLLYIEQVFPDLPIVLTLNLSSWNFVSYLSLFKFLTSVIPLLLPSLDLLPESRMLYWQVDGFLKNTTMFARVFKCKLSQYEGKIRKHNGRSMS